MIFLDLDRSKYIGVSGPQLHALSELILGTTSADRPRCPDSACDVVNLWIERLTKQRLLTQAPTIRTHRRPRLLEAAQSMDTAASGRSPDWLQLLRLWRSTWVTSIWVRQRSLASIADRVLALRALRAERDRSQDQEALRSAVADYVNLRPFALTTNDRCLNDSLTLIHFLACQGFFPQWIIGVQTQPFCAHSWVQHSDVVLNDLPERVRGYQPILIV